MNQQKIVIIDYGMGNLRSVLKKIELFNCLVTISSDLEIINKADKIILPGVGHFARAVQKLNESGIWDLLNHRVLIEKTPILGICLGMQLMAKFSEEGNIKGFGWFDAQVTKFNVSDSLKYKIPHIGWNNTIQHKTSRLFDQITEGDMFYFVHSYYMNCLNSEDILATSDYEDPFTSVVEKDNIFGTQFHPEKSHDCGEKMLSNFIELI